MQSWQNRATLEEAWALGKHDFGLEFSQYPHLTSVIDILLVFSLTFFIAKGNMNFKLNYVAGK
jgi:hypothetical protein